jgi:hypothetical protein
MITSPKVALTDLFAKLRRPPGALPAARATADGGNWLAVIPVTVAAVFASLMVPHAVPPDEVPLPTVDARALAATVEADDDRVRRLDPHPLPAEIRAVGSALRAFNVAEAHGAEPSDMSRARTDLDNAFHLALSVARVSDLVDLRALEMQQFMAEVRRYERHGEISAELTELGGTFIQRMVRVGWCVEHRVLMDDAVRRVAFKLTWNKLLLVDNNPSFAVTLDEMRVLYGFYFKHAHPFEGQRPLLDAIRASAHDPASIRHANDTYENATAAWLMPKVDELARVDPTYPEPLARAAIQYLRHDYAAAGTLYERWQEAHPNGPWSLRVQNHLRATVLAEEDRGR